MESDELSESAERKEDRIFCQSIRQQKLPHGITQVELIHLDSPVKFSVINKKRKKEFVDIRQCVNALYGHVRINKEISYIPMEDELVVVFFALGRCWCRGKVLEVHSDYSVTIRYVDYGNVQKVPFYMIRKADEVLQHYSMQAIDLRLADAVLAKELTESEKWRLKQIMPRRQEYRVTDVYGRGKLPELFVKLEDCATRTDIRDKLLELGFIIPYKKKPELKPEPVEGSTQISVADKPTEPKKQLAVDQRKINRLERKSFSGSDASARSSPTRVPLRRYASRSPARQRKSSLPRDFGNGQPEGGSDTSTRNSPTQMPITCSKIQSPVRQQRNSSPRDLGGNQAVNRSSPTCAPRRCNASRSLVRQKKNSLPTRTPIRHTQSSRSPVHQQRKSSPPDLGSGRVVGRVPPTRGSYDSLKLSRPSEQGATNVSRNNPQPSSPKRPSPAYMVQERGDRNEVPLKSPLTRVSNQGYHHDAGLGPELTGSKRLHKDMFALRSFFPGKQLDVQVIYVGEKMMYVHDKSQSNALRKMTRDMNYQHNKVPPMKRRPPVNSLVAARHPDAHSWKGKFNRARVESWPKDSDKLITVFFLDFGDTATVPMANVCELVPSFLGYDFQAVPVQLEGLKPDQRWPLFLREQVVKLVYRRTLDATVIDCLEDRAVLDITFQGKRLSDLLVSMGLEKVGKPNTDAPQNNNNNPSIGTSQTVDSCGILAHLTLEGESHVVVLHAESFENFWVIPESSINDFCNLGEKLKKVYSIRQESYRPKRKGEVVVNFCNQYEEFYRAVVREIKGSEITVRNLDWGLEEVVSSSNLYKLDDEFSKLPIFGIKCALGTAVIPGKTVDVGRFESLQKSWRLKVLYKATDRYVIDLFEESGESLIESLAREGLVEERGGGIVESVGRRAMKLPPSYAPSVMYQLLPIAVVECRSLEEIFVHVIEERAQNLAKELSSKLEDVYKGKERPNMIVSPGDFVVVQCGPEKINYRVVVKSKIGDKYKVHFVDFGNEALVDKESMAPLTQELREYPQMAIKCKLQGVTQNLTQKWPTHIINQASNAVFLTKVDNVMIVELRLPNKSSVRDKLLDVGALTLMESVKPEAAPRYPVKSGKVRPQPKGKVALHSIDELPPLKFKSGVDCAITYVESPRKFFIQIHDDEFLHMEQASIYLQRYCAKNTSMLRDQLSQADLQPDMLLAAKFPVDDKFYRAQLVHKVNMEEWRVFFVDFGDMEVVHVSNMLMLADVFINIPPLALMATKLKGVDDREIFTEDLCDYLMKELTLAKAVPLGDNSFAVSLSLADGQDLGTILDERMSRYRK